MGSAAKPANTRARFFLKIIDTLMLCATKGAFRGDGLPTTAQGNYYSPDRRQGSNEANVNRAPLRCFVGTE